MRTSVKVLSKVLHNPRISRFKPSLISVIPFLLELFSLYGYEMGLNCNIFTNLSQVLSNGVPHIVVPVVGIPTILAVENVIEAVSFATAAKPRGVGGSPIHISRIHCHETPLYSRSMIALPVEGQ